MFNTLAYASICCYCSLNDQKSKSRTHIDDRISADYGSVEVAKSSTLQNDDLFGRTMNLCSKNNSKAPPNGMVIGGNLYEMVRSLGEYTFENVGEYLSDGRSTIRYIL
jgi:class 3 adenylate cyclase